MKFAISPIFALALLALLPTQSFATDTLYWDIDGPTPGAGHSSSGSLEGANWSINDSTGVSGPAAYESDSDLVFSAGSDYTGTQSVTVNGTDSVDGFTFNNGTVTLFGASTPNLSIGAGGVTLNSTDGSTKFDSSLGTVTVSADQFWNNDGDYAFNVNSGVTGSGQTLTFQGTGLVNGTGIPTLLNPNNDIYLNGVLSGTLNLTQDSATSALHLVNAGNSFTGTVTAENGGTIFVAHSGSLNGNGVVLSNGGIVSLDDNQGYSQWNTGITLENGGGTLEGNDQDIVFAGAITGDDVLNVSTIDLLTQGGNNSDISTINILDNRMMVGSYAILGGSSGTTVVNVDSGAVLGFGWNNFGGTFGNEINPESGSAIENRGGGNILTDVLFPGSGTVTIGSDDSGGGFLAFTTSTINLTGDLEIDIHGHSGNTDSTSVYLNNPITGSGSLTFGPASDGTSSYLFINNDNNVNSSYTGTTTINDLTVYPHGATPFGSSTVTLNGATIRLPSGYDNGQVTEQFVLGTGTNLFDGNYAGGIADFTGSVVNGAGNTLHLVGSNNTIDPNAASNYSFLDLDSGRTFLLGGQPLNFIANGTVVNVASGAILDFSSYATLDATNTINFASGSGLTVRNYFGNFTNVTLENAMLPTTGSFIVGADDVGGGNITLTHGVNLTGDLTIENSYQGNGGTSTVTMKGAIGGTGGIIVTNGYTGGAGILILGGANDYSGGTTITSGTMQIASTGSLPTTTAVEEGGTGTSGTLILGDAGGAVSTTIAGLTEFTGSTGNSVYNGNTHDSTNSSLNVDLASGTDTYHGTIGNSSVTNGNNLSLTKSGAGTLSLTGTNTYTGGTEVAAGKLAVDGSIAGNAVVDAGAEIGGHGTIAGAISGAGAVGPGNSPGILTASSVDPSAGTSFNFEFTLQGSPDYSNSSASINDVLHLTGATPFAFALTSSNTINLYFSNGGDFVGGFFVDGSDSLTANVLDTDAIVNYYVINNRTGTYSYNGNLYDLTSGTAMVIPATFGASDTSGYTEEFDVVPEPSTYALMGLGGFAFLFVRRRIKA